MTRRIRILAVDDEASILSLIKTALADNALDIQTAVDGELAWRMVREIRPDIVILDLGLPGIRGMDLLDRIVEWNSSGGSADR
jgi:two-component system KDP operon response regulator KdpE